MADDGNRAVAAGTTLTPAACARCTFRFLCFAEPLPSAYQVLLPLADPGRIRLRAGEFLFRADEPQRGVYAIKAGFLKRCMPLPNAPGKIVGFHTMGSVLGLDSLGAATHRSHAIAMNSCEVCVIPLDKFEQALAEPAQAKFLRQLQAAEIAAAETHAAVIGSLSAKQRVATFLLDMSSCWEEHGYSKREFILFMSRKEIGNFLGLTFETVSRALSYFQAEGMLQVNGKKVLILDLPGLRNAAR